jgi:hypothetical protein
MDAQVRTKVMELFEMHRAVPGVSLEEHRFLDYLLPAPAPAKKGALRDSLRGLRRFNAFIDAVQLEFGVCFSLADRDADYSLDRFCERVTSLQRSRHGSLKSLRNQVGAGPGWRFLLLANLILWSFGAFSKSLVWLFALVCVVGFAMNACFIVFAWRSKTYLARLQQRIEETA